MVATRHAPRVACCHFLLDPTPLNPIGCLRSFTTVCGRQIVVRRMNCARRPHPDFAEHWRYTQTPRTGTRLSRTHVAQQGRCWEDKCTRKIWKLGRHSWPCPQSDTILDAPPLPHLPTIHPQICRPGRRSRNGGKALVEIIARTAFTIKIAGIVWT